jgi:hypothetical protein
MIRWRGAGGQHAFREVEAFLEFSDLCARIVEIVTQCVDYRTQRRIAACQCGVELKMQPGGSTGEGTVADRAGVASGTGKAGFMRHGQVLRPPSAGS